MQEASQADRWTWAGKAPVPAPSSGKEGDKSDRQGAWTSSRLTRRCEAALLSIRIWPISGVDGGLSVTCGTSCSIGWLGVADVWVRPIWADVHSDLAGRSCWVNKSIRVIDRVPDSGVKHRRGLGTWCARGIEYSRRSSCNREAGRLMLNNLLPSSFGMKSGI